MEICLRRAKSEDFERINELFSEMLQSIYQKQSVQGYQREDIDYYFRGGEDWICVAEIHGKIEGFLSVEVHREPKAYIYYDDFCVSEKFRGRGVGTALMRRAEEYAQSIGVSAVILHVEESNLRARKFYESRGFTTLRRDGTRWCMVKHLE